MGEKAQPNKGVTLRPPRMMSEADYVVIGKACRLAMHAMKWTLNGMLPMDARGTILKNIEELQATMTKLKIEIDP